MKTAISGNRQGIPFNFLESSFKQILSFRAVNNSNDVFITYQNRSYTWKEIEEYSQIIAHDLCLKGVKRFAHIGIVCGNSINFVLTFFALQKLGAIAVFINNKLTFSEICTQCNIGDVTGLCIGDYSGFGKDGEGLLKKETDVLFTYDISDENDFAFRKNEYKDVHLLYRDDVPFDDPSLIIFSSGSTGKPKATILSTYNLINGSFASMEKMNINEHDSLCLVIPLFHIFAFKLGFVYSMIMNNRISICVNTRSKTMIETIERDKCTLMHAVPSLMLALINSSEFSQNRLSSLRVSMIAGAAMPEPKMKMLMKALPNLHIISLYGLSEFNPLSHTTYNDTIEHICKSVGKVCEGISLKIIEPNTKKECKPFESGEVLVKGDNNFVCYYKLPASSQCIDADGYVHTGDLGYVDNDGYLYLTGRIKEIIIRGGENILPSEIVSAISEHENINEVMVIGIPDDFLGESVAACLSLHDQTKWNEEELNRFLSKKIAPFKIPSRYMLFDQLPKLGNGKYDRQSMINELLKK